MTDVSVFDAELGNAEYIIGLDIGDGESCLAWVSTSGSGEIEVYTRPTTGETSILTALALHPETLEHVFGEEALSAENVVQFAVNFKEAPTEPLKIPHAVLFAQALLREFFSIHPEIRRSYIVFVGHPAGWSAETTKLYGDHFVDRIGIPARLLPESQSALIDVWEAETPPAGSLDRVLIVDIGSSTIDITAVNDLRPVNIPVAAAVGCRQIDDGLAAQVEQAFGGDPAFAAALRRDDGRALLRLACRRVKEAQFKKEEPKILDVPWAHANGLGLITDKPFGWLCEKQVPRDVTQPGGWADSFAELLGEAARTMATLGMDQPRTVILTGGGCRMPFTKRVCEQVFPQARVTVGRKPSQSVARGLASAGCHRRRVMGFKHEVLALIESPQTTEFIRAETMTAFDAMKEATLEVTRTKKIATWANADYLANPPMAEDVLSDFRRSWDRYISPRLDEICERYGIASGQLEVDLSLPPLFTAEYAELIGRMGKWGRLRWVSRSIGLGAGAGGATATGVVAAIIAFAEASDGLVAALYLGGFFAIPGLAVYGGWRGTKGYLKHRVRKKIRSAEWAPDDLERTVAVVAAIAKANAQLRTAEIERFVT